MWKQHRFGKVAFIKIMLHSNVAWRWWCLKSTLHSLFNSCLRLPTDENSKLCITGPLWGESIDDSFTKGLVMRKVFPCHDAIMNCMINVISWPPSPSRLVDTTNQARGHCKQTNGPPGTQVTTNGKRIGVVSLAIFMFTMLVNARSWLSYTRGITFHGRPSDQPSHRSTDRPNDRRVGQLRCSKLLKVWSCNFYSVNLALSRKRTERMAYELAWIGTSVMAEWSLVMFSLFFLIMAKVVFSQTTPMLCYRPFLRNSWTKCHQIWHHDVF